MKSFTVTIHDGVYGIETSEGFYISFGAPGCEEFEAMRRASNCIRWMLLGAENGRLLNLSDKSPKELRV